MISFLRNDQLLFQKYQKSGSVAVFQEWILVDHRAWLTTDYTKLNLYYLYFSNWIYASLSICKYKFIFSPFLLLIACLSEVSQHLYFDPESGAKLSISNLLIFHYLNCEALYSASSILNYHFKKRNRVMSEKFNQEFAKYDTDGSGTIG